MSYEYEKYIKQPTASYPAITPTTSAQTADVTEYASVTVNAMPTGSATTPATTITAQPAISVNASGLITATNSKTQSVTPTVSAGYVASGTAGTITVNGSNTSQLTTQAATTITPTTSVQTAVASNVYTTGAVIVAAMPEGTLGTTTATKGTVSNNSITVTPNVSAGTAGYNTHSAYSGTAVTVSASELVSGTTNITGTSAVDVTNSQYAQVVDSNLVASNIKNGVDILGISGTYKEIDTVSSVPSTKSTEIIYNTSDSSYYVWEYEPIQLDKFTLDQDTYTLDIIQGV